MWYEANDTFERMPPHPVLSNDCVFSVYLSIFADFLITESTVFTPFCIVSERFS